jgi:hypothetical protein
MRSEVLSRVASTPSRLIATAIGRGLESLDDALWDGGEDADAAMPARPDALASIRATVPAEAEAFGLAS